MRVCIIGAGFAGIITAKQLRSFGHEVTVYDLSPDVGGVWSRTRRYPGVKTQNSKQTYALSDEPMPDDFPTHPEGWQVQKYLEMYVEKWKLAGIIQLETEVTEAKPAEGGWAITICKSNGNTSTTHFDHLTVCTGAFSKGFIPNFADAEAFLAAGGRICHTSDIRSVEEVKEKNVVVIGYGKSACDSAQSLCDSAASTTVVARHLIWKLPTRILGAVHYSYLLLTRLGESLFQYIRPWRMQRFLGGIGSPIRAFMLNSLQFAITAQLGLRKLGIIPPGPFENIARSTVSLVTDGFYSSIQSGQIKLVRDTEIELLKAGKAKLSNGDEIDADVIVCGTGFVQLVPFFSKDLFKTLVDDRGNWTLYRHILPLELPNLTFNGFNSSLFCPLTAEVTSLWIARYLMGDMPLPSPAEQRAHSLATLAWMDERSKGKHAHGTNLVPFSMSNIDDMMLDLDINIGRFAYAREWLLPVDPSAYEVLAKQLVEQEAERRGVEAKSVVA